MLRRYYSFNFKIYLVKSISAVLSYKKTKNSLPIPQSTNLSFYVAVTSSYKPFLRKKDYNHEYSRALLECGNWKKSNNMREHIAGFRKYGNVNSHSQMRLIAKYQNNFLFFTVIDMLLNKPNSQFLLDFQCLFLYTSILPAI